MPQPSGHSADDERFNEAVDSYEAARDELRSNGVRTPPDRQKWLTRYADIAVQLREHFANEDDLAERLGPLQPDNTTDNEAPPAIAGLIVGEKIGVGGMGSVYKARQRALGRVVALKTVLPKFLTKQGLESFYREARLLAKCSHSNIVKILEFHPENSPPYFLMEYVDGIPLDQAVRKRPWKERASLLKEVVAAVAGAHEHGVVHGDLKPANIVVDHHSKPHILDFGLGRLLHQASLDSLGQEIIGGTPGYLAPEVLELETTPNITSDIYALGVTMYVLLTGVLPYQNRADARQGKVRLPMEHDSDIPEALQRICLKAMDPNPGDRYQTAELMQHDLERFSQGEPVLARPAVYLRELDGRLKNHLSEIQLWHQQGFIDQREKDHLAKPYGTLLAADSPWLSETRKILTGPLFLRTGAWLLLLSALLWPCFYWSKLDHWMLRLASAGVPTLLMASLGTSYLYLGNRRNALACLSSFALLLLVFEAVVLSEFHWLEFVQPLAWEAFAEKMGFDPDGNVRWMLPDHTDGRSIILVNSQIFTLALTVTVCIILLLRFLRAVFFSSWLAVAIVVLFSSVLLLIGDKERLYNRHIAWVALHYFAFGPALYFIGYCLEKRSNLVSAQPFYFVATALILLSAVYLAYAGTDEWFGEIVQSDNQTFNLWLMAYAPAIFLWAWLTERFGTENQRALAWVLYLLGPIFALVPLNLLFAEKGYELFLLGGRPVRIYEVIHLFVCAGLLIGGKFLRIGTFLQTGLWGSAVWVFRVTYYHFEGYRSWPLSIGVIGCLCVGLGVWYSRGWNSNQKKSPVNQGSQEKVADANGFAEETVAQQS